ncbi:MAG: hypothetical protein NT175_02320 [Bacteroidetes bacterium]|nr:hypothetical protein [Bacteroidota bacterium]
MKIIFNNEMKKTDKLKHTRYILSMKIIELESKQKRMKLTKNEIAELEILKDKVEELSRQINDQ